MTNLAPNRPGTPNIKFLVRFFMKSNPGGGRGTLIGPVLSRKWVWPMYASLVTPSIKSATREIKLSLLGGSRPPDPPAFLGRLRPPRPPGPGTSGANKDPRKWIAMGGGGGRRPPRPLLAPEAPGPGGLGGRSPPRKAGGSGGREPPRKANFPKCSLHPGRGAL